MANIQISVSKNGTTTLATAGKYCDRNIDIVTDVPTSDAEEAVVDGILSGTIEELYNDRVSVITQRALQGRESLRVAKLLAVKEVQQNAFSACASLETVEIKGGISIGWQAFSNCKALKALVIRENPANKLTSLANTNAFDGSSIADGTGYVYVPDNSVNSYKSAAKWSTFAGQIKPLSEYGGA